MAKEDLKLVIALTRSYHQLVEQLSKNSALFSLSISELGVLEMLYHKGKQPVQKIAEKILVTSGTITYVIRQLEKKGWVKKMRCQTDQRIYYVMLTEAGETLIKTIFPKHEAFVETLFQGLSIVDKQQIYNALTALQTQFNSSSIE